MFQFPVKICKTLFEIGNLKELKFLIQSTFELLVDSRPCTGDFLWEIRNKDMYWYVNVLYCNRRRLLRVSCTYCGHNMWPKHVGGYTDYNVINLHIGLCTCCLFPIRNNIWVLYENDTEGVVVMWSAWRKVIHQKLTFFS